MRCKHAISVCSSSTWRTNASPSSPASANMARVSSVSEVMPFSQACASCPSGAPSRLTAMSFAVANKAGNHKITRPKGLLKDSNRCFAARRFLTLPWPSISLQCRSNQAVKMCEFQIFWTMLSLFRMVVFMTVCRWGSAWYGRCKIPRAVNDHNY